MTNNGSTRPERSERSERGATLDTVLRDLVTKREFSDLRPKEALVYLVHSLAQGLDAPRVGIWEITEKGDAIQSVLLWDQARGVHFDKVVLQESDARSYIAAVKEDFVLRINDAMNDPRCAELAREYLPKNNVCAMLDCPIRTFGGLAGVVCIEQTKTSRIWTDDEVNFALSVTGLISLTLEHERRIAAEMTAADHENRLRDYASLATDWYWDTDTDFRFLTVEGNAARDGQDPQYYVGRIVWEVAHLSPTSRPWSWLKERVAERKRVYDFVVSARDANGTLHYAELAGLPRYDPDGQFLGYWGTVKDVTARMRRETELAESERRYRAAARLAGLGSWTWDQLSDRASYCSPELAEIYGVSVEDYLARTTSTDIDMKWFHPEDRERYRAVISGAAAAQTGYEVIARIVKDNGDIRTLHEITEPVFDSEGQFVATSGVLQDVTERAELQERLKRQEDQFRSIVANLPGALYRVRWDAEMSPIYRSEGYAPFFLGMDAATFKALPRDERPSAEIDPEERARIDAVISRSIADGQPYEVEYPVTFPSGEERWANDRGRAVVMPDGSVELEGIMLDVTERHTAQHALAHAQKLEAIGKLTGGIAHDFNNLLAVILGNLELLNWEDDVATQRSLVNNALAAVNRGADLNRSMLAFAQKSRLQLEPLQLRQLVETARGWIGRTLPATISLQTDVPADLWSTTADASSTESALLNLILNARDAMPDGGTLRISARNTVVSEDEKTDSAAPIAKGDYVLLSVSDTGTGIPAAMQEQIFEPFYTTKPPGSGSGLGLSMVMGYMQQSGGHVRVQSTAGEGTTFQLYFRANHSQHTARPATNDAPAPERAAPVHVLVVEDDEAVLTVMVRSLSKAGYHVASAPNGNAALEMFDQTPGIDVLLSDIVMPGGLQGPELAKALREKRPDLPVVLMSGYAETNGDLPEALAPPFCHLQKPISRTDLISAVEAVMSERR